MFYKDYSVTWGKNLNMNNSKPGNRNGDHTQSNVEFHELIHCYQQIKYGSNQFYGEAMNEQIILEGYQGINVYDYLLYGDKYHESTAAYLQYSQY